MDKTIYFILSKQSRMQTGLYFQLVVVTKCKQYFHVSSTLSTLVLYYSISHCSPKKTHFISKSLVFQFDSHLLPFAAYFVFFSICHWNKIRRRRCQSCIHVAESRVRPSRFLYIFHCIYSVLEPTKIRQNEHITRRERSTLSSSSNHHPPPPPLRERSSLCVLLWLYVARLLIQKRWQLFVWHTWVFEFGISTTAAKYLEFEHDISEWLKSKWFQLLFLLFYTNHFLCNTANSNNNSSQLESKSRATASVVCTMFIELVEF